MKLPNPRYTVELVKSGRSRYYALKRGEAIERLKSVTQILDAVVNKPALQRWYAKTAAEQIQAALLARLEGGESKSITLDRAWIEAVIEEGKKKPKAVASEAADLGTLCHKCFESITKGLPLPVIPEKATQAVAEFRKWYSGSGISMIATELPVASAAYLYGGTLDFLGERGGKVGLIDYKTSSGIYTEMALQAAGGYKRAVEEMYGLKVEWVEIVRVSKAEPHGSEACPIIDLDSAEKGFLHGVELARTLELPLIGSPTYTTFAANEAAKINLEVESKTKTKIQSGFCPF